MLTFLHEAYLFFSDHGHMALVQILQESWQKGQMGAGGGAWHNPAFWYWGNSNGP